ncbi:MAG: hypothetical protein WCF85_00455 [Rhodospirillaceae bacterium]
MLKKKELWLAFSGDELTCTCVVNDGPGGRYIEIELAGMLTPARLYVYDLIMDVIENSIYETVFLNARNLVFFSGQTVNDCAIEQLLKFVCYFSQNEKNLHVMLEDGCVKDVLKKDLPGKKYKSVTIADNPTTALAKDRLVGSGSRL